MVWLKEPPSLFCGAMSINTNGDQVGSFFFFIGEVMLYCWTHGGDYGTGSGYWQEVGQHLDWVRSQAVVRALHNTNLVPRSIKSRWLNCLHNLKSFGLMVTHIYREDNTCADILASLSLTNMHDTWYNHVVRET